MATLPTIKRFLTEDFPGQANWIGGLFYPLNLLLNTIYSALNNGLTLSQNIMTQVKTLSVSGSSPSVSFPYSYTPNSPIGVSIISVVQTSSASVTQGAVSCIWTFSSGTITINVQGLVTSATYNLTFIVWGG